MNGIYFIVRIGCMLYVLYRLWMILFRYRMFGIWNLLFNVNKPMALADEPAERTDRRMDDVLGKTHIVYLEAPADFTTAVPVRSEELPPSDFIGEEEEILTDAVEDTLSNTSAITLPSDEELYEDAEQTPLDTEFSRGLTYDEISNAVGVLKTATADVDKTLAAARTIFNLKSTELFEFFTTQVSNAESVERLLAESLGGKGLPLLKRETSIDYIIGFQLDRYI